MGCKKEINQNYNHSRSFVESKDWFILQSIGGNDGKSRKFKLQEAGTNNFLIIDPVDPTKFWQPDYRQGSTISGLQVIDLLDYVDDHRTLNLSE